MAGTLSQMVAEGSAESMQVENELEQLKSFMVRARPGRLHALPTVNRFGVVLFVWARRALSSPKRRVLAPGRL